MSTATSNAAKDSGDRRPLKKAKGEREAESETPNSAAADFLNQEDAWVNNIFPFLGMGHFAFVGATSKKFNELYKKYCDSIEEAPSVIVSPRRFSGFDTTCPGTGMDTYYGTALPFPAFHAQSTGSTIFARTECRNSVMSSQKLEKLETWQLSNGHANRDFHGIAELAPGSDSMAS